MTNIAAAGRTGRSCRTSLRHAVAVGLLMMVAGLSHAQTAAPQAFDIPAGTLIEALDRFGEQSGLQVTYDANLLKGKRAPAVNGKLSANAALERLLKGTGLGSGYLNDKTIIIKKRAAAPAPEAKRADKPQASLDSPDDKNIVGMPAILVQGANTLNLDIRRTEDDPQPYIVFDREQIENSMAVDLENFLKTRLPMNAAKTSNNQSATTLGNQSQINLRGLGTAQTLILIDGRRVPGGFTGGDIAQADINGIPLAAIERVEVLPSTASGIYGGGATGGVINIILRRDYSGGEVKVTYENSFESDVARRQVDARMGFTLGEKTNVMVAASYADGNPLLNGERDFFRRSRELQLENNPSAFYGASIPPLGATSNIRSVDGSALVLRDGRSLGSAVTHVPIGYGGAATDSGDGLLANAGTYNLDLADSQSNSGARASMFNNPKKLSLTATLRHAFSERVEGFLDLSSLDNEGRMDYASFPPYFTLAASSPSNPFTTSVMVTLPERSFDGTFLTESKTRQATAGLIVRLPGDWVAGMDYTAGKAEQFFSYAANMLTPAGTAALSNGTLDPLRDTNLFPIDLSPYLNANPSSFAGPTENRFKDVMLRLAGPLFDLPAGPVVLSSLLEYRDSDISDSYRRTITGSTTSGQLFPARSQSVSSAYVESRIPLVSERNARPGIQELDLQASVRYDEYTTNASTAYIVEGSTTPVVHVTNKVDSTDSTFGLRYMPVSSLTLRASYGTGFQPPSTSQLIPRLAPGISAYTVFDPLRGNTIAGIFDVLTDGNPNLQPEESKSFSTGFIFQPQWLPGFRLSLDYTQIKKSGEIATLAPQEIVDNEAYFPGRVVRGAKLPTDPASWAGPIQLVDVTLANVSTAKIAAYDLQMDYSRDFGAIGSFSAFAAITRQQHLQRRFAPTTAEVETVGFNGGPLEWRGNVGLTWSRGPLTLGWTTTYFDSYYIYAGSASQATRDAAIMNQGAAEIPSQTYHDAFARYRFPVSYQAAGLLDNVELMIGIKNVFNESPPIIAGNNWYASGAYSTFGDPRLRSYSISIQKSF